MINYVALVMLNILMQDYMKLLQCIDSARLYVAMAMHRYVTMAVHRYLSARF